MTLKDLEIAKSRLKEENLTLSIVKNGKVLFETVSHGVSGFLDAVEKCGSRLEEASVADRIVGKAIALLCVYAKVRAVYAVTLSKKAKAVLEENSIYHEWENLVENILGVDGKNVCPFEKLADEIPNPKEAYKKLRSLQQSLKHEPQKENTNCLYQSSGKREVEES